MDLESRSFSNSRELPVFVLADVSGSMRQNGKIDVLNRSVRKMIEALSDEDGELADLYASVITFGGDAADVHVAPTPVDQIEWSDMNPYGRTPMGDAFRKATTLLENRDVLSERAYRPVIVLVSDGIPTDDWQDAHKELVDSDRGSKATRLALGIGSDANHDVLQTFTNAENGHVMAADEAEDILTFFTFVTMSVTSRSRSANPNDEPDMEALQNNFDEASFDDDIFRKSQI
jgi:uncharacterized protein YegL